MAEGKSSDLVERMQAFTLRVIKLCAALPDTALGRVVQHQLLKAGTSAGANYRAAKRAKSRADFIAKMGIVEEEVDESLYWMEVIGDSSLLDWPLLRDLHGEGQEILAMVVASITTAKRAR